MPQSPTPGTYPPPRRPLPKAGERFITDAGLETELVFKDGRELPHFSAAVLLDSEPGRERLRRYYQRFVELELAAHYRELMLTLPALRVMGGCCGTDAEHVESICRTCLG